jgi:hypothetical protein
MVKNLSNNKIIDKYLINGGRYNEYKEKKEKTNICAERQRGGFQMPFAWLVILTFSIILILAWLIHLRYYQSALLFAIIAVCCMIAISWEFFFKLIPVNNSNWNRSTIVGLILGMIVICFWLRWIGRGWWAVGVGIFFMAIIGIAIWEVFFNPPEDNEDKNKTSFDTFRDFFKSSDEASGDTIGRTIFFVIIGLLIILISVIGFVFFVNILLPSSKLELSDKIEKGLRISELNILTDNRDAWGNALPQMVIPNTNPAFHVVGMDTRKQCYFDVRHFVAPPRINKEVCISRNAGIAFQPTSTIVQGGMVPVPVIPVAGVPVPGALPGAPVSNTGSLYDTRIVEQDLKKYTSVDLNDDELQRKIKNYFSYVYDKTNNAHLIFFKLSTHDMRMSAFGNLAEIN